MLNNIRTVCQPRDILQGKQFATNKSNDHCIGFHSTDMITHNPKQQIHYFSVTQFFKYRTMFNFAHFLSLEYGKKKVKHEEEL